VSAQCVPFWTCYQWINAFSWYPQGLEAACISDSWTLPSSKSAVAGQVFLHPSLWYLLFCLLFLHLGVLMITLCRITFLF
jgi:hypothetical protein